MNVKERLRLTNEATIELSRWVSLASRIEPALLRHARLNFMPQTDASLEADLWFSLLVQIRGARFIILEPEVKNYLRTELAKNAVAFEEARKLVREMHEYFPELGKLEEELVYQSLKQAPDLEEVDSKIQRILIALIDYERLGLARWALGALPNVPEAGRTPAVKSLITVSEVLLYGNWEKLFLESGDELSNEIIARLLRKYGSVPIGVTFLNATLRISEPPNAEDGDEILRVPAFPNRVIDLTWQDESGKREKKISWQRDSAQPVFVNDISLPASIKTISGETYRISSWQEAIPEIQVKASPFLVHILDQTYQIVSIGCLVRDDLVVMLGRDPSPSLAEQKDQRSSQYFIGFPFLDRTVSPATFDYSVKRAKEDRLMTLGEELSFLRLDMPVSNKSAPPKFRQAWNVGEMSLVAFGEDSKYPLGKWGRFEAGENGDEDYPGLQLVGKPLRLLSIFHSSPLIDRNSGDVVGLLNAKGGSPFLVPLHTLSRAVPKVFGQQAAVFVYFNQAAKLLAEQLKVTLQDHKKAPLVHLWNNSENPQEPNSEWEDKCRQSLKSSNVAAFIVDQSFLSDRSERTRFVLSAIEGELRKGLQIVPIILRPAQIEPSSQFSRIFSGAKMNNGTESEIISQIGAIAEELVARLTDPSDYAEREEKESNYYLRIEAVNLDNFIYDTPDLSTVRGGGLLVLNAVDSIPSTMRFRRLHTLTTGASVGLYEFNADSSKAADAICADVQKNLARDTELQHATFAVSVQPKGGDETFAQDIAALQAKNRWQQMQSPSLALSSVKAAQVCEIDLVRPATRKVPAPESEFYAVSDSVAVRRLAGQRLKQNFYQGHIGRPLQRNSTHELQELTADKSKGNLNEKMAVIYLDGNKFGSIKKSVSHSSKEWLKFDQTVKSYRREMLGGLLDRMEIDGDWQTREGKYRIETLLWGGDELMWIVPAWKGWETLQFFYEQSQDWHFNDIPLRHSAGLVFCHHNAPIQRIRSLAIDLAELAKDKGRENNYFAYEVLESFDHIGYELERYRRELILGKGIDETDTLILTGESMSTLSELVSYCKTDVPRKQIYEATKYISGYLGDSLSEETIFRAKQRLREEWQERESYVKKLTERALREGTFMSEMLETIDNAAAIWLHVNALWDYLA